LFGKESGSSGVVSAECLPGSKALSLDYLDLPVPIARIGIQYNLNLFEIEWVVFEACISSFPSNPVNEE